MALITDVYLSSDVNDYIKQINRPILHLKTITGGELRAEVCSQSLKDYTGWITDRTLRHKIDTINVLFQNCPENRQAVQIIAEKVSKL